MAALVSSPVSTVALEWLSKPCAAAPAGREPPHVTCHLGASQVLCSAAAESARNLEAPGQFIRLRALISPQHKPENLGSYFCQPSCQPDLRKLGFQPERLIFHVALARFYIEFPLVELESTPYARASFSPWKMKPPLGVHREALLRQSAAVASH